MKTIAAILLGGLILAFTAGAVPPPETELEREVDSLMVIASSGQIKYRELVQPAKDSLAVLGGPAVPRLIEHYSTKSARKKWAIHDILVKIGSPAVDYLLTAIPVSEAEKRGRICYTLGFIGDSAAVDGLVAVGDDADWRVRSNAAAALGKIGDKRADETVLRLLDDSVGIVRKSAVVACGQLQPSGGTAKLVHLLGDDFYGARMTASEALIAIGSEAIDIIADSLGSVNRLVGNLGCTTLGKIGGDKAAFSVSRQLIDNDPIRRALAVETILIANSSLACGFVEIIAETETDPLVLYYIDLVMKKYAQR
jgi:HEAT repeat protein